MRELLHLFTVAQPISELQQNMRQHYSAFISLLLMELNYGLWYSQMINHIYQPLTTVQTHPQRIMANDFPGQSRCVIQTIALPIKQAIKQLWLVKVRNTTGQSELLLILYSETSWSNHSKCIPQCTTVATNVAISAWVQATVCTKYKCLPHNHDHAILVICGIYAN